MRRDISAAIAPVSIKIMPRPQPHRPNTYGKLRTPDPIADAQSAKILPLTLPLLSFEKVLA
jgi:hypothetical protein